MNVITPPQVEVHVPVTSALPFPSAWVASAGLSYAAKPADKSSLFGILEQVLLDLLKNIVGRCAGQLLQPFCECARIDEYHNVVYTTK
jgi:hypothetical protein